MATHTATTCNGFDIGELRQWIDGMRDSPQEGMLTLHTRHTWDTAGAVDGVVDRLAVGGETIPRSHRFRSDFPVELGGGDTGPAPGELLLAALGACVTGTYAEKAALAGVAIDGLEVTIDTSVDLRGAYDVTEGSPALRGATITIQVRADADADLLAELGRTALRTSPVARSLAAPVPLEVSVLPAVLAERDHPNDDLEEIRV